MDCGFLLLLLNGYKIFLFPCKKCQISFGGGGGGVAVLLGEDLKLQLRTIFADPEGKLVVLSVTHSSAKTFILVAAYAPFGIGQSDYFRRLDNFLGTKHTLMVIGDFNTICNSRADCVGSNLNRSGNLCLCDLLSHFQLAGPYKLILVDAPVGTWTNSDKSSRSCLEKD